MELTTLEKFSKLKNKYYILENLQLDYTNRYFNYKPLKARSWSEYTIRIISALFISFIVLYVGDKYLYFLNKTNIFSRIIDFSNNLISYAGSNFSFSALFIIILLPFYIIKTYLTHIGYKISFLSLFISNKNIIYVGKTKVLFLIAFLLLGLSVLTSIVIILPAHPESTILKILFTIITFFYLMFFLTIILTLLTLYSLTTLLHFMPVDSEKEHYNLVKSLINAIYLSDELIYKQEVSIKDKEILKGQIKSASHALSRIGKLNDSNYTFQTLNIYLSWIFTPEESTFKNLSNELCLYLRAAITGYYHYFPKKIATEKNTSHKQNLLLFSIFMILPIIIILIIDNFFWSKTFDYSFYPYYILYGFWGLIGINIFFLKKDERALYIVLDITKEFLKKTLSK